MRTKADLKQMQKIAATLIVRKKKLAIFMKPGCGKTATTLFAFTKLKFKQALIVAPPRVCETVWEQESNEWEELSDFDFIWLNGTPKKRSKLLQCKADFHLISYDSLKWLASEIDISSHYDALVFDELCMLKNPSSQRFKAIKKHIDKVPISIGLTGTPTGNNLLGFWSQIHSCVGSKNPLGLSHHEFKRNYFVQGGFENRQWLPVDSTFPRIRRAIRDVAFSFELDKEFCPVTFNPISVKLPGGVQKQYDQLKNDFMLHLKNADIFALSSSIVSNKLRQIEAGSIYDEDGVSHVVHDVVFTALDELISELNGESLIIIYEFRFQLQRLMKKYPDIQSGKTPNFQQNWNNKKIRLLALNPASCGHGLNLQHGGCNMIFLTPPWSVRLWLQTLGRIIRSGQQRSVSIYYFKGFEVGDMVYRRLRSHINKEKMTFKELEYETRRISG